MMLEFTCIDTHVPLACLARTLARIASNLSAVTACTSGTSDLVASQRATCDSSARRARTASRLLTAARRWCNTAVLEVIASPAASFRLLHGTLAASTEICSVSAGKRKPAVSGVRARCKLARGLTRQMFRASVSLMCFLLPPWEESGSGNSFASTVACPIHIEIAVTRSHSARTCVRCARVTRSASATDLAMPSTNSFTFLSICVISLPSLSRLLATASTVK